MNNFSASLIDNPQASDRLRIFINSIDEGLGYVLLPDDEEGKLFFLQCFRGEYGVECQKKTNDYYEGLRSPEKVGMAYHFECAFSQHFDSITLSPLVWMKTILVSESKQWGGLVWLDLVVGLLSLLSIPTAIVLVSNPIVLLAVVVVACGLLWKSTASHLVYPLVHTYQGRGGFKLSVNPLNGCHELEEGFMSDIR